MKPKMKLLSILRLSIQVIFFILLPALYVNAFTGIQQIYLAVLNQSFELSALWPQIVEAVAIVPATVLLGRFFCGWMCAFGTLGDLIYLASGKIFKTKFSVSPNTDKALKTVKYLVLAFLVIAVWTLGIGTFSSASPWNVFGMIATVGSTPDIGYVVSALTPGFAIFLFIVFGSFFVERFFCRYLCPLGAVFAIASRLRFVKIRKPGKDCGNCMVCTQTCAMGINMKKADVVSSGECINCFRCISDCPHKNVTVAVSEKDLRPLVAGVLAVSVITGTYYAGSLASNSSYISYGSSSDITTEMIDDATPSSAIDSSASASTPAADTSDSASATDSTSEAASASSGVSSTTETQTASQSSSTYADGTYQGTGTGFHGGQTTVSVTVKDDTITDIQVVSHGDDAPFFNRAASSVISSILNSQSTEVSAVSGATYSSNGIMDAVADALNSARQS